MRDSFSEYHPLVNFLYFALVIGFSLALINPIAQLIALTCALIYATFTNGKKSLGFLVKFCLPVVIITAAVNPLFNHRGATILAYFSNGNALTLESILYGVSSSILLVIVLAWFASFNKVMTTDKFSCLFGKIIPSVSLILSMSFRFIPRLREQAKKITEAQRSLGRDIKNGGIINKIKIAIIILSNLITWAFENSVITADSMKSRGYGIKKPTSFTIYSFKKRDKLALSWLIISGAALLYGIVAGNFKFSYFPSISYTPITLKTLPLYFVYFALCITPIILNLKEELKWKYLVSKI